MADLYYPFQGDKTHNIVVCSGMIGKNANKSKLHKHRYLSDVNITYDGGRMTLEFVPTSGKKVTITNCAAQQGETASCNETGPASVKGRAFEGCWFSSNVDELTNDKVYIHEMHQGNANNDTWMSETINHNNLLSISVIVFGWFSDN